MDKENKDYPVEKDLHWLLKNHPKLTVNGKTLNLEDRIKIDAFFTGYLFGQGRLTIDDVGRLLAD